MNRSFCRFVFTLFFINTVYAQELTFAKRAGSDSIDAELDQGHDIITDSSGNIYVTGIMSNWTTGSIFGQGEVNQTTLNVNGAFIAKYDSTGLLLWAKQIEANNNMVSSNAIALDANGNIYITGYYGVEITFGVTTPSQTTLFAVSGSRDIFFAKYNNDGDFLWAKSFGGTGDDAPGGNDIEIDTNQNIYITGAFHGTVTFGSGETNETTLNGAQWDMFLSKYDSNGNLIWVQKAGGADGDSGKNLDLDASGNIYLTGNFNNSVTFGESLSNETMLTGITESAYIAKYTNNGNFLWARSPFYATGSSNISGDIKVVNGSRIVYTGSYFSFTRLTDCVSVNGNSEDMITIGFDTDGNYIWNTTLKSNSDDRGVALDVDASGRIYVTGYFGSDVVLDAGQCNETTLQNKGRADIYITVYDSNGQLLRATQAGGSGWDTGAGIDVDDSGNIYITGFYREDIVFGESEVNETTLLKNGFNEIYVAKYQLDLNTISGTTYAGESNCIEVCQNSDPINLFNSLLHNPVSGGSWSPALTSGSGVFDPAIDPSGIYRYSVMESGCISDYSEITISFNGQVNAGEDATVTICAQDAPFDLFDSLNGNPDTGGFWGPALASGTGVFDPAVDPVGVYTYTVSKAGCNNATAQVTVNWNGTVHAGDNGMITACFGSATFNLFDSLSGTPDAGGSWTPSLASGTGMFDPSVDVSGIYTYTVSDGSCAIDTAEVDVTIDASANAGDDGLLEICITANPVDLISGLTGTPGTGGTWTPSLVSGSGVFDPSVDAAGIYTYIISGACGSDSANVNVTITNVTPITDYSIETTTFSSNNTITIMINSNLSYEYSLDGINYQTNNEFNHLPGGDYIIYVRGINGCGVLQEPVSILDYPKYFTPNNDGTHDYWALKGRTNENYTLYIYDRYGKLLKHLASPESRWDGTLNGTPLPSDDYWFRVVFSDGQVKNGHFALKR